MNTKGIIIGGGPSLDFEFIKNFDGLKLVCDTVLKKVIDQNIIPEYVFSIEDISIFYMLFDEIPREKCRKITVVHSLRAHENTIKQLNKSGYRKILDDWKYLEFTSPEKENLKNYKMLRDIMLL